MNASYILLFDKNKDLIFLNKKNKVKMDKTFKIIYSKRCGILDSKAIFVQAFSDTRRLKHKKNLVHKHSL